MRNSADDQQLVDAILMLEVAGIIDYNGHGSVRTGERSFLINSGASNRGAMDVGDLVEIDLDGKVLRGDEKPPMEYHIHAEIYRARPDVGAVIHAHPKWSTVLTIAGHKMKPVYAQGTLLGELPVFANPLSVSRHISSRSEPGFWKSDTNAAPPASELRNIGPAFAHTLVFCCESTCTIIVTSLLSASLS